MTVRPKTKLIPPVSPYVDPDGAAQFLWVAPQTLANWRLSGGGPPFAKIRGTILYAVADLISFVESKKVQSTSAVEYRGPAGGRPSTLSRLDRDGRTELAARVRAGELSASAAAIAAGFRKSAFTQTEDQPAPLASPAE
jgi:hypothetical protein